MTPRQILVTNCVIISNIMLLIIPYALLNSEANIASALVVLGKWALITALAFSVLAIIVNWISRLVMRTGNARSGIRMSGALPTGVSMA